MCIRDRYKKGDKKHNMTLLSEGDLYVARLKGNSPKKQITGDGTLPRDGEFDGSGEWLPLVKGGKSMIKGMSVEEVLVYTRPVSYTHLDVYKRQGRDRLLRRTRPCADEGEGQTGRRRGRT